MQGRTVSALHISTQEVRWLGFPGERGRCIETGTEFKTCVSSVFKSGGFGVFADFWDCHAHNRLGWTGLVSLLVWLNTLLPCAMGHRYNWNEPSLW